LNKIFFRWIVLSILLITCAFAQTGGATLQDTVKDATGSVIPGAKIAITKIETGVKSSTTSNSDGYFTFPPVAIGKYLVHCESPGMKA
jgi:Carboxypeptidase regulatory-like domain